MKNKFIFTNIILNKNILLKNILLISLLFAQSCSSLSKSKIINTKQNEAISVLELKIIIDDKEEKDNSGIFGECHLVFGEDNGNVKFNNSKNYSFYIFKTNTGVIKIKGLKCSNWGYYFKNRYLSLGDLEFIVKPNRINYLGNLVINYESRGFGFLDIFGLGAIVNDNKGSFDIKIYDNIEKSIGFLREFYPELKARKVSKSLVHQAKNYKNKINELNEFEKQKNNQNNINNNEFLIENNDKKEELNKNTNIENKENLEKNNSYNNQRNYDSKNNLDKPNKINDQEAQPKNNKPKININDEIENKNKYLDQNSQNPSANNNKIIEQNKLKQNDNQVIEQNKLKQNDNQLKNNYKNDSSTPSQIKSYENTEVKQDLQSDQIINPTSSNNQNKRIGKLIRKNNSGNLPQDSNPSVNQITPAPELPVQSNPSPTRYRPAEIQ